MQNSGLDRVTAIVVTYNSSHCLEVLATSLTPLPHIIIVDNASDDDTLERAGHLLPQARLIANTANLGFGAANNRGVVESSTEFVLLINPDCSFNAEAVAGLVACADRFPDASAIGPQLLDRNGRPEATYRWFTSQWKSRGPGAAGPLCVGFISGACILVRTAAMRSIGGFDESFFLYYEDDDLCIRLHQQCGALIVDPSQHISHYSRRSVAGPRRMYAEYLRGFHHIQSKFHYREKHQQRATTIWCRAGYVIGALAGLGVHLITLQRHRAAREFGRVMGATRYRPWPAGN